MNIIIGSATHVVSLIWNAICFKIAQYDVRGLKWFLYGLKLPSLRTRQRVTQSALEGHLGCIRLSLRARQRVTQGALEGHLGCIRLSLRARQRVTQGALEGYLGRVRLSLRARQRVTQGALEGHLGRVRGSLRARQKVTQGALDCHLGRARGSQPHNHRVAHLGKSIILLVVRSNSANAWRASRLFLQKNRTEITSN